MCIQPCHAATDTPAAAAAIKAQTDGRLYPGSVAVHGRRTRSACRPIPERNSWVRPLFGFQNDHVTTPSPIVALTSAAVTPAADTGCVLAGDDGNGGVGPDGADGDKGGAGGDVIDCAVGSPIAWLHSQEPSPCSDAQIPWRRGCWQWCSCAHRTQTYETVL